MTDTIRIIQKAAERIIEMTQMDAQQAQDAGINIKERGENGHYDVEHAGLYTFSPGDTHGYNQGIHRLQADGLDVRYSIGPAGPESPEFLTGDEGVLQERLERILNLHEQAKGAKPQWDLGM